MEFIKIIDNLRFMANELKREHGENQKHEILVRIRMLESAIKELEHDGWIPVEDGLPGEPEENPELENKKLELYLVNEKNSVYPFRAFWNGKEFTDGWRKCDVIAWRPLPDPYKGRNEENEKV